MMAVDFMAVQRLPSDGTFSVLSGVKGNAIVCILNRLRQPRITHEPCQDIRIDTKHFVDFCPSVFCIAVDTALLSQWIFVLDIPNGNERMPFQKTDLLAFSVPFLNITLFQFALFA